MQCETVQIIGQQEVHGGYRVLRLDAPLIAPRVRPGQFVHVRLPHMEELTLRRPFSVYKADGSTLGILYKQVGKGTRALAGLRVGDPVHVIGPLGNGFPALTEGCYPVLVAGGYGMAPLYLLARSLPQQGLVFVGGKTASDILCVDEFKDLGWEVRVATEDGSLGERGLVTDPMDAWWAERQGAMSPVELYACGPNAMLRAVADRAAERDWRAWVSVDRHMACGVGACLTCVLKVRDPNGGWQWKRSCKEGPVFDSREICWETLNPATSAALPPSGRLPLRGDAEH